MLDDSHSKDFGIGETIAKTHKVFSPFSSRHKGGPGRRPEITISSVDELSDGVWLSAVLTEEINCKDRNRNKIRAFTQSPFF